MLEWYALDAIERYREKYPDLTMHEEDAILDFSVSSGGNLFFRCTSTPIVQAELERALT